MKNIAIILAVLTFGLLVSCAKTTDPPFALSSEKAIITFSFASPAAAGVIMEGAKTIAVTVPSGTAVTALVATFSASSGASVKVGAIAQVSGVTANNFTNPVTYTVTAADGSTVNYSVTVSGSLSSAKAITAFSFVIPPATGTINEAAKTIAVTVPSGTAVTALVATFTVSAGARIQVGAIDQVSGTTANNFMSPVTYVVTAADDSQAVYTATVTVASGLPALSATALASAYMAYYGAITALSASTPSLDSATGEYVVSAGGGSATARYAMNLASPMLMAGSYIFSNYHDAASGYTINGNLSYVLTMNSSSTTCLYYKGTLTYSGGTVSGLSLDYSMDGSTIRGTMTAGTAVYEMATYSVCTTAAVETPAFSLASGAYSSPQSVSLTCATPGAVIHYTTDGSVPTSSSATFTGTAIPVNSTLVIRAIAIKSGMADSVVSMGGYVLSQTGGVGIGVNDPANVTVTLSGQSSTLAQGSAMTVTVSTSKTVDSYAWYVDGALDPAQTTSTYTGGASLAVGPHGLMVVVKKSGSLFSATCYFTVQ